MENRNMWFVGLHYQIIRGSVVVDGICSSTKKKQKETNTDDLRENYIENNKAPAVDIKTLFQRNSDTLTAMTAASYDRSLSISTKKERYFLMVWN